MDTLFLKALRCQNKKMRPPVWLMRQAGRYLPQYRAMRSKYSFLELCRTPDLATQATLLPIEIFEMDAAILFSDILVMAEALGVGLQFSENGGPMIERPLKSREDVKALPRPVIEEKLGYVKEAIQLLKPQLKVPLIGFCGAPFTLASYFIEGKTSRDFLKTKQWLMRDPESFHDLLEHLAQCTIDYLKMQIQGGVDAIQIFDSWVHILSYRHFREFSFKYLKRILEGVRQYSSIPMILFCRGSSLFVSDLAEMVPDGISLDWQCDLKKVRQTMPQEIACQGNFDPDLLYAPLKVIQRDVRVLLEEMQGDPGYIVNLGHGIKPDVSAEAVKVLVDTVKQFIPK